MQSESYVQFVPHVPLTQVWPEAHWLVSVHGPHSPDDTLHTCPLAHEVFEHGAVQAPVVVLHTWPVAHWSVSVHGPQFPVVVLHTWPVAHDVEVHKAVQAPVVASQTWPLPHEVAVHGEAASGAPLLRPSS